MKTVRAMVVGVIGAAAVLAATGAGQPAKPGEKQPEKPAALTPEQQKEAEVMAQMNAPRPEHKVLADMCGTFDLKMTMFPMPGAEPMVINATSTREMVLGGKFMKEVQECKEGPMPFTSLSFTGFNPDAQGGARFETTRMSSMITCMMPETGTYDAATKTLTSKGEHDANGMKGKIRVVHRLLGGGKETAEVYLAFEGYSEQFKGVTVPEYKAMVLEYTRR